MTNILDVLKEVSMDELVKQQNQLLEQSRQLSREAETLTHVIAAVKELRPGVMHHNFITGEFGIVHAPIWNSVLPNTDASFIKASQPDESNVVAFHEENMPETLPAVAEWPDELTPKESTVSASELQAAIDQLPDMSNPSGQASNRTKQEVADDEYEARTQALNRVNRYGVKAVLESTPTVPFDMENVSMERKVRTYLEAAGSSSAMAMARAFDLPNAKTLIRMLEADPSYERDSRGFWSIKK